ncbi:hypothetical protein [Bacillus toyonensis]|uniref:hypothetical protein n=1 Tax=Bacillus toyonensis TaxID=155322 RepID=UPI000BF5ABFD|nr:hypothetical protein [Bacillus toyonensis]PGE71422.1 hypothetical protein COM69_02340 [Bacillus toyonensis]PHD40319.1 hypothetical protein COF65_19680 [Bacillus toyonensis]HDR7687239.1 hypothetical protein [Bacillus toyonensis]
MFPIGEQPNITKDLVSIAGNLEELAIEGKTKNIERLASLQVKKLWVFAVNQKQFEHVLTYARPDILYVYEMRVEDLSSLQKLSVALPYTECEFFKPYVYMNDAIGGKNIMVTGRRRPFLNSKTDTVKMQKYEEQFKKLQEEYKGLVESTM